MKTLISFLFLSLTVTPAMALSGPHFSAFTEKGILYVTVLVPGGSCNEVSARLQLEPNCKADRSTKNWAPLCFATLALSETLQLCQIMDPVPKVVAIDLDKNNVAPEANQLSLVSNTETIRMMINR